MARPGRPERNRAARSFRHLRRFHHVINSNKVFGTHSRKMTAERDFDVRRCCARQCPLLLAQRTQVRHRAMSQKCQTRKWSCKFLRVRSTSQNGHHSAFVISFLHRATSQSAEGRQQGQCSFEQQTRLARKISRSSDLNFRGMRPSRRHRFA